mgnify:CR=1 FL=1
MWGAFNATSTAVGSGSTGLATKAAKTQPWSESFIIEFPEDGTYTFAAVGGSFSIEQVVTESAAGSMTLEVQIDGAALGGSPNAVSTSRDTQAHDSDNTHSDGQDLSFVVSAASGCERASITLIGTETLA